MPRLDTVLTDCSETWGRGGGGGDVRDLIYEVVCVCVQTRSACLKDRRGNALDFFRKKIKLKVNHDPKKTRKSPNEKKPGILLVCFTSLFNKHRKLSPMGVLRAKGLCILKSRTE